MDIEQLKYPIGKYTPPVTITDALIAEWISELAEFPSQLSSTVAEMDDRQLATPYRDGGWTVRQVLHHLPDSHMNAYIRFKWALTEDKPTIKAYYEDRWAQLDDSRITSVHISLHLLEALHARWVALLRSMNEEDFKRVYLHPHHGREYSLREVLGLYVWHGKHHRSQIEALKQRMGWQ